MSATPGPDAFTRVGRTLVLVVLVALLLWFAYRIRIVLLLLVASLLVGYALEPLVGTLSGHNPRWRGLGIALAFLAVFAGLVLVGVVILGPALREASTLEYALAAYAQYIQAQDFASLSTRFTAGLRPELRAIFESVAGQAASWLSQAGASFANQSVAWAKSLPTFLLYAGVVLSMTGLLLGDKGYFKGQALQVVPTAWQRDAETLLRQIDQALAAYVRGQLIIAGGVGLLLTVGMLLLGVHYALPLGLFSALMQLVPVVGGALGLIAAVGVAAFQNVWVALEVLVLFSVMFFVSGNILGPKIMGRAVTMHPLIVLVVTFAGTLVGGVAGLLLAVPVTAILRIIVVFVYQRNAAAWHLGAAMPQGQADLAGERRAAAAPPETVPRR